MAKKTEANGPAHPPPVPIVDAAAFRRKLAGMVDPLGPRPDGPAAREHTKLAAIRLCVVLADLYDAGDKDRIRLWDHISKAMDVADERTADGDVERFVSEALATVKADGALAAASRELGDLLAEMDAWPPPVRHAFLHHVRSHRYAVLSFGQRRWKEVIAGRQAERERRKSTPGEGGSGDVLDPS